MSKVAARQPLGNDRINLAAMSKEPHRVGKSSAFIPALTDVQLGFLRGKDRSCIMRNEEVPGLGTSPSGDVRKGPIMDSSS